jgi:hypothetical protein
MKNVPISTELSVDLENINRKYHIGQFRWFQSLSSKCNNFTWGLSKIISSKIKNRSLFFIFYVYLLK